MGEFVVCGDNVKAGEVYFFPEVGQGKEHAASSGFSPSPIPIAAISAARAAEKGTTFGRQYSFPPNL